MELRNANGRGVGTAEIRANKGGGITVTLNVKNLPPGEHALYLHRNAKCEAPGFTSTGGYFNLDNSHHRSFIVKANGRAKATFTVEYMNMDLKSNSFFGVSGPSVPKDSIFSNGGTTMVIDAQADDMTPSPSGNTGEHIACGEIMLRGR